MTFAGFYKELLRRYPLARGGIWVFFVLIAFFCFFLWDKNVKRLPVIESVNPPVGLPGDVIVIKGKDFGETRDSSYVEIAGSRITSSGYISWSDTKISIVLPSNVQDGLVIVGTSHGQSNPSFFANSLGIPQKVRNNPETTLPTISSISPTNARVGQTISIFGSNFGNARGTSAVYFTMNKKNADGNFEQEPAHEADFDYEVWSDTEIQVRVPDGAKDGDIFVFTSKGKSKPVHLQMTFPAGKKTFGQTKTYIVELAADIQSRTLQDDSEVSLYVPRPALSASQSKVELQSVFPEPVIADDARFILHRASLENSVDSKSRFSQKYLIQVNSILSEIQGKNVRAYSDKTRLLYSVYTSPDSIVLSDNEIVTSLAGQIVGKEKNPYNQAKLLYNYIIDNYTLKQDVRIGNPSILDLPATLFGDAYDFALFYASLCRAIGIPALPISGVIAQTGSSCQTHWWTEIYFENYGWFPVDIALASGLDCGVNLLPSEETDVRDFYFGNLDDKHITISRGWREIKPSLAENKTVYIPRSYSLQSIWEEADSSAVHYTSLWNNPVILGVY